MNRIDEKGERGTCCEREYVVGKSTNDHKAAVYYGREKQGFSRSPLEKGETAHQREQIGIWGGCKATGFTTIPLKAGREGSGKGENRFYGNVDQRDKLGRGRRGVFKGIHRKKQATPWGDLRTGRN